MGGLRQRHGGEICLGAAREHGDGREGKRREGFCGRFAEDPRKGEEVLVRSDDYLTDMVPPGSAGMSLACELTYSTVRYIQ